VEKEHDVSSASHMDKQFDQNLNILPLYINSLGNTMREGKNMVFVNASAFQDMPHGTKSGCVTWFIGPALGE